MTIDVSSLAKEVEFIGETLVHFNKAKELWDAHDSRKEPETINDTLDEYSSRQEFQGEINAIWESFEKQADVSLQELTNQLWAYGFDLEKGPVARLFKWGEEGNHVEEDKESSQEDAAQGLGRA